MSSHTSRVRTLSLSFGMVLGMAVGAYAPQMAHAATTAKTTTKAKAKSVRQAAVRQAALPEASPEQLYAVDRVLLGTYACEFGKSIQVAKDVVNAGYITLKLAKESWVMKPVLSSTGAIRLEDVKGQTLLLQILTKSMLMNVKAGKRVVDGCVHDTQRAAEEHLRANPQPSNL